MPQNSTKLVSINSLQFGHKGLYLYFFQVCSLALFTAVIVLAGCDGQIPSKTVNFQKRSIESAALSNPSGLMANQETYNFGFDLRSSVEEDARQYQPLITYLSGATGYKFNLVLTSQEDNIDKKLGSGELDFAAIGAVTHIKAVESFGVIPLVRGLNSKNKAEYQSVIVTNRRSPLNRITDLKGKRFAFGNENSTQGYLIPRIVLEDHGISLEDLKEYRFMGSHRNCANAVISGQFDACGLQDTMGKDLEANGLVRIIHTSNFYPSSGISASPKLSPEVIDKVRQALINFKPKGRHDGMLYNWDKTEMPNGFKGASKQDYLILRKWMGKFGLIFTKLSSE